MTAEEWVVGSGQRTAGNADAPFGSTPLRWIEATLTSVEQALALEEGLLAAVDSRESPATLLLWEWSAPAVIVGRSNAIAREVAVAACESADVPIRRRCSGGGAVVIGPGCLCYALILPVGPEHRAMGISTVTRAIMHRTASEFVAAGFDVTVEGISDLAVAGRKFSGNSQRWLRSALLHHGTILYDFDLACVARYLQFPSRQPDYRADRDHTAFVRNLPVSKATASTILASAWNAVPGARLLHESARAEELLRKRYTDASWHLGKP